MTRVKFAILLAQASATMLVSRYTDRMRMSDDADVAFVAMMVPHHQAAIEMARTELRDGHNAVLQRMAQEIIVTQQQEIEAMQRVVDANANAKHANNTHARAVLAHDTSVTSEPDAAKPTPVSHRDRVYSAEQFSNTVSVTDPADNKLLGVIRLGDQLPGNMSPLYRGQVLVHGLGFSPDHRTLAVVSIGSNSVTFIDTRTNAVKHVSYVGRSPHEAFFTPDGNEVWVTIRGEDYIEVLDGRTFASKTHIAVPNGPGMQIFSPDGKYGYVCSSFTAETDVISVADHRIVGRVPQVSPFCPNIAATPDGNQVWLTLKDVGKVMVFDAKPPFAVLKTIDTGPITNHVNFTTANGATLAYVTVGGLNEVQVIRTDNFSLATHIPVGSLPHGIWPSGDGSRMYVGLENDDQLVAIDVATNRVVASVPVGQAPQAVVYIPDAVPDGDGLQNLEPLGAARGAARLHLVALPNAKSTTIERAPTSVSLFDQGLVQIVLASVTGLVPRQSYVLGLSMRPDGSGAIEPLATFVANPAGAAAVTAVGPVRQVVKEAAASARRYLTIVKGTASQPGAVVQVQARDR